MGTSNYHVLFVGDIQFDVLLGQEMILKPSENPVQFSWVSTYPAAIQFMKYGQWDAVLVSQVFDCHTGLEFIHHSRLLGSKAPIILLCHVYDDDLDYKARKIGATDSVSISMLDGAYLYALFAQKKEPVTQNIKKSKRPPFTRLVEAFFS